MHLLLTLAGCPAPSTPPPADDPVDPSPWTFSTDAGEAPPLDPDALGRALSAAVPAILTYDAEPLVDAYLAIVAASATPDCPAATLDPYGNRYWADACTAPDGTYFGGYLSEYVFAGTYDPYSGLTYDGAQLAGNVVLTGAGRTFDLEGAAIYATGTDGAGIEVVVSALVGGFYYDAAAGWLGEPTALTTTLTGYSIPAVGGAAVVADGSVPVEVDGERYDVWFHLVSVANAAAGSLCEAEPGGTVEIRDPYGRWVDVTFHGPIVGYDAGDPARCDGCGDAVLDGNQVAPVCADFDPFFAWEKLP